MNNQNYPRVGIGVMIIKDGKVLLGKRINSHGDGEYSFPGGHLEYRESFADCAKREVREECGIEIKNIRFQRLANIIDYAPHHYVDIDLLADWDNGAPLVLEPDKMVGWNWYELGNMPQPLFKMCQLALDAYQTGQNYYDIP